MSLTTYEKNGAVTESPTMTALVQHEFGDADVLEVEQMARPTIGPDEVLVRVRAAGIDKGTWHVMLGLPYLGRAMFGWRRPKQPVVGLDVAGVVEAVGDDVTRFAPGDEVMGIGNGSLAQWTAAQESKLVAKPADLPFEQAGALAVSGLTALQALRRGDVQAGQSVLIVGASGGVGSYAVQLAKAMGAEVTGVASTAKLDFVRSLGADHVIDYTATDFTAGPDRWDVILDIGGNRPLRRLRRALAPKGTLVIVGGDDGGKILGGVDRGVRGLLWSPFIGQKLTMFISEETHADIETLARHVEAGELTPAVDRVIGLDEVPDALRDLGAGRIRGKVAVTLGRELL